jgi:hypothetical protein
LDNGVLNHFETTSLFHNPEQEDCRKDNPPDRKEAERRAKQGGAHSQHGWHLVNQQSHQQCYNERGYRGQPSGTTEDTQQDQDGKDWKRRHQRGSEEVTSDGGIVLLPHEFLGETKFSGNWLSSFPSVPYLENTW